VLRYGISDRFAYEIQIGISLCLGDEVSVSDVTRGFGDKTERACPANVRDV